jgi:hypothetical protein
VIDDELRRNLGVNRRGIAAQRDHRLAHGGEVDDRWDAGEVLKEDARRTKRDLVSRLRLGVPLGDGTHFLRASVAEHLGPDHVLEEDAKRVRKPSDVRVCTERAEPGKGMRRAAGDDLLQNWVTRLHAPILLRPSRSRLRQGTDAPHLSPTPE